MGWCFLNFSTIYTTEGIVLKRFEVGEADSLFVIYTKDFGKIRALAQGVKKENAKLKGHLEILSLSNISFVLGRHGERLTQAKLINFWPVLQQDPGKFRVARQIIELVDQNCLGGEKDESLWKLLLKSLIFLGKNSFVEKDLDLYKEEFIKKLSACLGYGDSVEDLKRVK